VTVRRFSRSPECYLIVKGDGISEILGLITSPISDAAPFGANINYEPEFDTLKAEIGKLGNLDLDVIEKASHSLLKSKAKDVRVLAFLSFVYVRRDQWEQLADVFDGMAQLAEKNFDALQPDRERAKQLAFKWLSEDRFAGSLEEKKPSEADYDHIARLLAALTKLKPILEQKFPDAPPFPSELIKKTTQWEKVCKPKPVATPAATPAPGAAASGGSGTAGSAEPMDTPKQAQASGRKAAAFLIEKEPQKPMGYRLMRCLRWDIMEKAPPAENGKTQLAPPPPQQRTFFQTIVAQQDWKGALDKAEAAFGGASNHVWLDLQRIIVIACERLGEPYAQVRAAVLFETASFVRRLPEIATLSFSDGSPFCDEMTKSWLSSDVQSVFSAGKRSGGGDGSAAADSFNKEVEEANALSTAGKLEEAIDLVQNGIRSSRCERDSFRRSMLVATLLLRANQPDIAVSVLEMLDQKTATYNLAAWDPELAVEAWGALVSAYRAAKTGKPPNILLALQEKQNSILTKVSYIDPKKAFLLTK
jgi:type VI secretion system protein VasJ